MFDIHRILAADIILDTKSIPHLKRIWFLKFNKKRNILLRVSHWIPMKKPFQIRNLTQETFQLELGFWF